ncbi:MAG: hypothetical protein ABSH00_17080 [Bryobacteraceae bacterium]|jgi:hypothetical protein
MNAHPVIDYESAVTGYMEDLSTVLRGFGPAENLAFLETWVPDEDPLQSILGIFEAAMGAGIPGVTVRVGAQTLAALDLAALEKAAATWGRPQFQTGAETAALTLSFGGPDPLHEVNLLYRAALEAVAGAHEFEGVLEPEADAIVAVASDVDLKLMALVVGGRHIVAKARYSGTFTGIERRLLERFCPILEGKPIIECSDHAVIELEFSLRDRTQRVPVPGVVMPENCDPMFALPVRLVRDLLSDYRRQLPSVTNENFYVRPSSPRWRRLSREQRQAEIAVALETFPQGSDFCVITIEGDRRVVIEMAPGMAKESKGSRLLQLERHLQQTVESVLQVHLQVKADLNTIRHIKGVRT